MKFKIQ